MEVHRPLPGGSPLDKHKARHPVVGASAPPPPPNTHAHTCGPSRGGAGEEEDGRFWGGVVRRVSETLRQGMEMAYLQKRVARLAKKRRKGGSDGDAG